MKFRIMSLLGIILGGCCFLSIKPAAEPMTVQTRHVQANLEPLDMEPSPFFVTLDEVLGDFVAGTGPQVQRIINWFEAKLEQKAQQIGTLKDTPEWQKIKRDWLAIKKKYENVFQLLAERFEIIERVRAGQLTDAQAREQLDKIFHNIFDWDSPVQPSDKELDALIDSIKYFGTKNREQQPLPRVAQPAGQSEVVQVASGTRPPVVDKQKQVIEDMLRKLESAVKNFEDYYRSHIAGDKYWFFQCGLSGLVIDNYWNTLELLFNQKNDIVKFIRDARSELKSSNREKIKELAKKIELYQEQLVQIRKKIGDAYDKLVPLWNK